MDITSSIASQAYARTRSIATPSPETSGQGSLGNVLQSFTDTIRTGEETAKSAMLGGVEPQALVQALAQTELAVETAVAVRNKVVEAYQEILRMPV